MMSINVVRFFLILWIVSMSCTAPLLGADNLGWQQLNAKEQAVLDRFKSRWQKLPVSMRKRLKHWAGMSSSERVRIRSRHQQWNSLSAASRTKIIRKLERYKRMPLAKRLQLQAWRKWVRRLPKNEQEKLHRLWGKMGADERKAYIRKLEEKYGKR